MCVLATNKLPETPRHASSVFAFSKKFNPITVELDYKFMILSYALDFVI